MAIRPYRGILPRTALSTYVDEAALLVGDVVIGEDSSVWPMCSVRGDVNYIRIGARTNVQDGTVVHVTHPHETISGGHPVVIGNEVTIGHHCTVHGCTIEDRCLIGMGSTILDGAVLREGVFLGAGSLVTEGKDLEGGFLWLGRPAKKIRPLTAEEKSWIEYSAQHYVKLKNDYLRMIR